MSSSTGHAMWVLVLGGLVFGAVQAPGPLTGDALAHEDRPHAPSGPAAGQDGQDTVGPHRAGPAMDEDGAEMMVGMPTRHEPAGVILAMPMMNSRRGMELFVEKGCVACHAINGVGGHDATALDAHAMANVMNPFDLAAKMWDMAPSMIAAQEEAFGEQLRFTGDELADITAFVHDDGMQHRLTEEMITPRIRKMMDHGHGAASGMDEHADEIGHGDGAKDDHDE